MKCPDCGKNDVHPIAGRTGYAAGEYACGSCGSEFYGKTMRDAIRDRKEWEAGNKREAETTK